VESQPVFDTSGLSVIALDIRCNTEHPTPPSDKSPVLDVSSAVACDKFHLMKPEHLILTAEHGMGSPLIGDYSSDAISNGLRKRLSEWFDDFDLRNPSNPDWPDYIGWVHRGVMLRDELRVELGPDFEVEFRPL
jgi:hypothetical protein